MKPKQTIEVLEIIKRDYNTDITKKAIDHAINCVGAIEQIKWERDIAISQLNELGLELGQKTDEVQRAIQHFNNFNLTKIAKGSDEE